MFRFDFDFSHAQLSLNFNEMFLSSRRSAVAARRPATQNLVTGALI